MIVTYTGPNGEQLIVNLAFVEMVSVDRGTTVLHFGSGRDVVVVADAHQVLLDLQGTVQEGLGNEP